MPKIHTRIDTSGRIDMDVTNLRIQQNESTGMISPSTGKAMGCVMYSFETR